jgi:hypothetical protein
MANEELWLLTRSHQSGQSDTQAEQHRQELARAGVSWGTQPSAHHRAVTPPHPAG